MQLDIAGKHKVFIQKIQFSSAVNGCKTDILRLDNIHPTISGNKFFKLKLHIAKALEDGTKGKFFYSNDPSFFSNDSNK
jgi:1-aminocyclopropane-1-carboxylate deaminase/D-cysteine desulfhydrase-like pyridoxal-dependent ACC family enzyme